MQKLTLYSEQCKAVELVLCHSGVRKTFAGFEHEEHRLALQFSVGIQRKVPSAMSKFG